VGSHFDCITVDFSAGVLTLWRELVQESHPMRLTVE
jgi:hypothetical protein